MNNIDDLVNQLQNGISGIPESFGDGDEIVASVTPGISQLLTQTRDEQADIQELSARRETLQKNIRDLSDNISILAQETVRAFKKPEQKATEIDEIKAALAASKGRSLF